MKTTLFIYLVAIVLVKQIVGKGYKSRLKIVPLINQMKSTIKHQRMSRSKNSGNEVLIVKEDKLDVRIYLIVSSQK